MHKSLAASRLRCAAAPAALLLTLISAGCTTVPADSSDALAALRDVQARLAAANDEQSEICRDLALAVAGIARERTRLRLLLELDALLTPDGRVDTPLIERLLREGSTGAVIRDVRVGNLTIDAAARLVADAARARDLSPDRRAAAEDAILAALGDWREMEQANRSLLASLATRRETSARLINEASDLTRAISDAAASPRDRIVGVREVASSASELIEDDDLRAAVEALIESLAAPTQTSAERASTDEHDTH